MSMQKILLLGLPFLFTAAYAADSQDIVNKLQEQQQQIDIQQGVIEQLGKSKQAKASVTECLPGTLPSIPRTPNYSLAYNSFAGGSGTLKFWRQPCKVGTGSVLLLRTIPTKGSPFFCSSQLKIIQNGIQLNSILLKPSICDNLFVPSTHIIDPVLGTGQAFNPVKALTIIYENGPLSNLKLNIPAGSPTPTLPNISGTANGYKSFKFVCKNNKTGVTKAFPVQTSAVWNCKGLTVRTGDTVTTTVTGIAK